MSEPSLVLEELFGRESVKRLTAEDFLLDTTNPTHLKWNDCMIVLFYGDNQESKNLIQIFATAAQAVVGPVFAAVNLRTQDKVARAFTDLLQKPGIERSFGMKGYPFILVYQRGVHVGYYQGDRAVQPIVDWAFSRACVPGYFEPRQLAASVHIDKDYEMGGVNEAQERIDSLQFQVGNPLRRYDPSTGIVEVGSREAAVEAQREEAERASSGVTVTQRPEAGETGLGTTPETLGAGTPPQGGMAPGSVASPQGAVVAQ